MKTLVKTLVIASSAISLSLFAQNSEQPKGESMPVVATAIVPTYPLEARLARIEGLVRLRVSTDGTVPSKIEIESGQPLLAKAAERSVQSWRFEKHAPTTLLVVFTYVMERESLCEIDNPAVMLRLPREVKVVAKGLRTCDPTEVKKVSR